MPVWEAGGLRYAVKARRPDWDPGEHPRHPPGTPQGGKFARVADAFSVDSAVAFGKLTPAQGRRIKRTVGQYREVLQQRDGVDQDKVPLLTSTYERWLVRTETGLIGGPHITAKTTPGEWKHYDKTAQGWLREAGEGQHPLAADHSFGSGQRDKTRQAKANIAAELASRLNNEDDWELFRAYHLADERPDPGEYGSLTKEERQKILDVETSQRVGAWAASSGDDHEDGVLMQEAVKQEFGLAGPSAPRMDKTAFRELVKEAWPYVGPFYRRVARVMYDHTQEELAAAGIERLTLYRGMHFAPSRTPKWARTEGERAVPLQPANAWTASFFMADSFTSSYDSERGIKLGAEVPAELVLGTARTGFGCLGEIEFVVLGADGEVHVRRES